MDWLLFTFPENEELGIKLLNSKGLERGDFVVRRFPDSETYIRIKSEVRNKNICMLCTLDRPDDKILKIYFFTQIARDLGARSILLVAPYLSYMRQDKIFNKGEGVTANLFANLVDNWLDALITFDPHLHRFQDLSQLYRIPTLTLHSEPLIQDFIKLQVENPVLIGPDQESEQWVARVAHEIDCDFTVLRKKRLGDRQVKIEIPSAEKFRKHTPVLIDDIISSGRTMVETIKHLKQNKLKSPICIGIHAIFADHAYQDMMEAGAASIITTNTISHFSNHLDVSHILEKAITQGLDPFLHF